MANGARWLQGVGSLLWGVVLLGGVLGAQVGEAATYYVATTGSDHAEGSPDAPFRTINRAAELARPGDTVVVHSGEYREWVRPRRGGTRRTTS